MLAKGRGIAYRTVPLVDWRFHTDRAGVRIGCGFTRAGPVAIAALDDMEFLHETFAANVRGTARAPSEANFVMTLWPAEAAAREVDEKLLRHGVIVRHLVRFGIANALRITIGLIDRNEALIAALA